MLVLLLCSCSTVSLKATDPELGAIEEAEKALDDVANKIPEAYLMECQWVEPLGDDGLDTLLYWVDNTLAKYRECYLIHNSLTDLLRERQALR